MWREGAMRKVIVAALFVLIVLSFLFNADISSAQCQLPGKKEIVLGGTMSLTGRFSFDGAWYKDGYELGIEDINKKGGLLGCPVRLVLYDDKSDPTTAVSLYDKLITVDKVDVLVGPWTSGIVSSVATVAEKYKKLFVQGGGCANDIFTRGYKYVFNTMTAVDFQHSQNIFEWAQTLPSDQRPKTASLTYFNNVWAQGCAEGARNFAKKAGVKIVLDEAYAPATTDFSPLVSKIKAAKPDMVVNCGYTGDNVLFARTMKELDVNAKVFWNADGAAYVNWFKEMGKDGAYIIGTSHWEPGVPYKGAKEFAEAFTKRWGKEPYDKPAMAYASLQVISQAIEQTKSLDQDVLRNYVAKSSFDLIVGPTAFKENGMPKISTVVYVMWTKDGKKLLILPPKDRVLDQPIKQAEITYPRPSWKELSK